MGVKTALKAWLMGRCRGEAVSYVADAHQVDHAALSIKDQVDAYVAGMDAAAAKSGLAVNPGRKRVERLPDGGSGDFGELGLLFLGGSLTFSDREGDEFTFKFSLDAGNGCSGCLGHGDEPTDEAPAPG